MGNRNRLDVIISKNGGKFLYIFRNIIKFRTPHRQSLLSTSEEAVLSGIELLRRPPGAIPGTRLQSLLEEPPADAALSLAAQEGGAGTLLALTDQYFPALANLLRQQIKAEARVSAWARLESQDRLAGSLLVADPSLATDQSPDTCTSSTPP